MSVESNRKLQYLTSYKQHYPPKKPLKVDPFHVGEKFKNNITSDIESYLNLPPESATLPPKENATEYFENWKQNNKKITEAQNIKDINFGFVKNYATFESLSMYQTDYGGIAQNINLAEEAKKAHKLRLPDDYYVPLTTNKFEFRDPSKIKPGVLNVTPVGPPEDNLNDDARILEIMKVETGESEYIRSISNLGYFIMESQMHGVVKHSYCPEAAKEHVEKLKNIKTALK